MSSCDVCLIGESSHSSYDIESHLSRLGGYTIRRQHMTRIDFTNPGASDLLVFDSRVLSELHYACLWRVAQEFSEKPMLIMANEIPISVYQRLYSLKNTATLQKPCELEYLRAVLETMRARKELLPTRFPRFNTDQAIRIMVMRTGLYLPSRMKNYSAGGAFVEYRGISLCVGDQLKVSFESEDLKSQRKTALSAKVIWIRNREDVQLRGPGVGVQFLQSNTEPRELQAS